MFKDIYKSANESIDTEEAFKRISKKIYEEKSVKNYKIYQGIAAAAACAAVICAVLFNMPESTAPTSGIQIAEKTEKNEKVTPSEMPENQYVLKNEDKVEENINSATETANLPTVNKEVQTVENTDELKNEEIYSAPNEEKEEISEKISIQVVMRINDVAEKRSFRASAYAATGASAAMGNLHEPASFCVDMEKTEERQEFSYEEYCEYIGNDIKSKITGFEDISAEFGGIYKDGDGIAEEDKYTFSFEKDDEYLEITVTKDLSETESFISSDEYEKSSFGETEAVIIQECGIYDAYFVRENTAYEVMLENSSEEELENVILSLIR